ncbi:hypothetical protein SRHO_G00120720 [Serrasalmus rhombeus]
MGRCRPLTACHLSQLSSGVREGKRRDPLLLQPVVMMMWTGHLDVKQTSLAARGKDITSQVSRSNADSLRTGLAVCQPVSHVINSFCSTLIGHKSFVPLFL